MHALCHQSTKTRQMKSIITSMCLGKCHEQNSQAQCVFFAIETTLGIARENPATTHKHKSCAAMHCAGTRYEATARTPHATQRQAKFATREQSAAPRFTAEEEKTVIAHRRLTSRSPTGILTDNLAGPEPLASSATAAEALATPCLGQGALLRARREHGSEAWSGGAGKATWWWWR